MLKEPTMNTKHFYTDLHHLSEEGAALYVDAIFLEKLGRLPEDLRRHTEGCEQCQRKVVELREMMKEMAYSPALPHPYLDRIAREPAVPYALYRMAAVIAGVGLLAAGYYALVTDTPASSPSVSGQIPNDVPSSSEQTTAPQRSTTSPVDLPVLADNFTESPNLEDLVKNEFRSTTAEILAPSIGGVVQIPVTFRWQHIDEPVTVKILNNKEKVIVTAKTDGDALVHRTTLAPGLYYWKLETEDELVFVGKFLVH